MKAKKLILKRKQGAKWPDELKAYLTACWKESDKDIEVTFKERETKRRAVQNALLFAMHNQLKKHIEESQGKVFDAWEIHEYVAGKLLPRHVVDLGDEPMIMRAPTKNLSVGEFAEFIQRYVALAGEQWGCHFVMPADLMHIAIYGKPNEEKEYDGL